MRHTWKTSPVTVIFITLAVVLVCLIVCGYIHGQSQRRGLVWAVTQQMEVHSTNIAALLSQSGNGPASQIEDAIYEELQRIPSTSLITRGMVSVHQSTGGVLECVIDTASLGLQARRIQATNVSVPKP